MGCISLLLLAVGLMEAIAYMPGKESNNFLTDALLQDMVERMGKDLADGGDVYLDFPETNRMSLMPGRAVKDLETEEDQFPMDYETGNPNPSIRDQEYLQHSSLWGHQFVSGGAGEGRQLLKPEGIMHNFKEVKTDTVLPAYCNPPNPCPVGYAADDGCLSHFENTAAFSRDYQSSQSCMCDSEHMFDCPTASVRELQGGSGPSELTDNDLDRIIQQFEVGDQHKTLVAKKFHAKKSSNPFLKGEKLPVAAKKGINVVSH